MKRVPHSKFWTSYDTYTFLRITAILFALLFMQGPQFVQNYLHILAGHLSELTWQLDQMRSSAEKTNKTLPELTDKFLKSSDRDIAHHGEFIHMLLKREYNFKAAFIALTEANLLLKPFIFMAHADWELVKETAALFKFGLPLTFEALAWALMGLFAGYLMFGLIFRPSRG